VVPDAVLKYRKAHPGVEVHLREGLGSEVYEDVRSGLADFGIGNVVGLNPEVIADEIVKESCFAVIPAKHPLNSRTSLSLRDLKDEDFVSLPTGSGLRVFTDGIAAANGIHFKHMTVVEQFGTLFDFVSAGVGVAIVPASALPKKRQHKVSVKPLASPAVVRSIGILRLKNRALTPAAIGFLDIFRPSFLGVSRL
jgi:LysR family carnitine catabolism transcriptional activator